MSNGVSTPSGGPCENTDRELFREVADDYYAPSLHVTKEGSIGINVGGSVYVKTLREWHKLVRAAADLENLYASSEKTTLATQGGNGTLATDAAVAPAVAAPYTATECEADLKAGLARIGHPDKRSAFNAWLDAEFYGINLTDHQINAMEAAFTAGASLPSKNGGQLGCGANGLRWFLETFIKALDMHNGHGTPTLQRAEAYALEAEAKLMLAGHSAPSARMPTLSEYTIEQLRQLRAGVDLELQARVLGNPIGGVVDGRSDGGTAK